MNEDSEPIDFFNMLLPDVFGVIAAQSNMYARQCQDANRKEDNAWKEVTVGDIKVFIAINIFFSIKQQPSYDMYWSSDPLIRVPAVADLMSKRRYEYEKISQYLHLNDSTQAIPAGLPGHDALFKVRPLLDVVTQNIQQSYNPGKNISIDETMIPFTGRVKFLQYIRGKPNPWGFKAWSCADSETSYLLNFRMYTGKSEEPVPNGLGHHVVTTVAEKYLGKYHHFLYDNFFSSVKLAADLHARKTYACSTIRCNRKGWPAALRPKETKNMRKGKVRSLQAGNLLATVWKDKREVALLSTNSSVGETTVSRRGAHGRAPIQIPQVVYTYNQGMGGIDKFDQLCSYYDFGRKSKKWWRVLFRFLFQVCLVNSWIIFKKFRPQAPARERDQIHFRIAIFRSLIHGNISRGRAQTTGNATPIGSATTNLNEHKQIRMHGQKLACLYCRKHKQYSSRGRAHETVYGCELCQVRLCQGECFARFHRDLVNN